MKRKQEKARAKALGLGAIIGYLAAGDNVDHIDLFRLLGADVEPAPIRAEHGVFGVLALHLDPGQFLACRRTEQDDAVVVLDRHCQ